MADRIKGITIEINGDTTGLSKALKGTNDQIKTTQNQLKDVNRLLKLDPNNTILIAQKQQILAEQVNNVSEKLKTLRTAAMQAYSQLERGDISKEQFQALQREVQATSGQLKELQAQAKLANSKLMELSEATGKIGDACTGVGKNMTKVSVAVTGIGAAAVKTTADYESAMSKVQAISGATEDDMLQLKDKAREMGAQTKFSATEAGEAMTYMAMAGWKTNDMLDGIAGIMDLAAASGEDLATTSDIVTDALTAFGLSADDTQHFVDVLAKASSSANTDVGMMGETFKYVAPVAGALKYSVDDVAVGIGLMANSGIKASQAGTSLRSILSRMTKPTDEVAAAMDELGLSLTNSDGNMKSFNEIMLDMRAGFSGLTEDQKATYAAMLGGQEAMSGLLAIVNASDTDFNNLTEAVANCDGTASQMADTMQNNLTGQLTVLKSQIQELAISIGESIMPKLMQIVTKLQELMNWLNGLSDSQKNMVVTIAMIAAAIGPLLIVVGNLFNAVSNISKGVQGLSLLFSGLGATSAVGATGITGLSGVLTVLTGPVGLVVAAIAAVIAIIIGLYTRCEDFRNFINSFISDIVTYVTDIISNIISCIQGFVEWAQPYIEVFIEGVRGSIGVWIEYIKMMIELALTSIKAIIEAALSIISNVIESVLSAIQGVVDGIMTTIQGIIDVVMGIITGDWDRAWNGLVEILAGIIEAVGSVIGNLVSLLYNTFSDLIDIAVEWGKDFIGGLIDGIKSMISGVVNAVTGIADKIKSILHFSRPDEGPLRNYEEWMPDFIGTMAKQIRDNKKLISEAVNGIATDMNINGKLIVDTTAARGADTGTVNNNEINFNGNYNFKDKTDIDYFMNQAALRLAVSR